MTHPYKWAGIISRLKPLALTALLTGGISAAQAQAINYPVADVVNVAGTYTDLGTSGTVITTANSDDANSAEQLIGFNFDYNGATMDRFILNTNGFLKLGNTAGMVAPTVALYSVFAQFNDGGALMSTSGNDVNLLSPFNFDLTSGTSPAEYRMATTGTAGNRVCTIQWKNVADKTIPRAAAGSVVGTQYANFSFQVKLYEANKNIEFVYGPATPASASTDDFKYSQSGIKGSGAANNQIIRASKGSMQPWADATFLAGPVTSGATGALNFRRTVTPDVGRTFRFVPVVANDVAVQAIYGFDKLVVPAGQPTVIRAAVRNGGTMAQGSFTVTLTISGANTATVTSTVPSLASNTTATVNFPAVALPNQGNNTVTVSVAVAGDANSNNDTRSMQMLTNPTTTGFITPNVAAASGIGSGSGAATRTQYFGAKISFNSPRDIVAVNAYIGDAAPVPMQQKTTVGETLFGVVIDATTGALLGRSPDFVVTAAAVETVHTFTLTSPVSVQSGDVIIGMAAVIPSSNTATFFPMGVQREDPTRPGTFFNGPIDGTATPPTPALNAAPLNVYKYMLEGVTAAPSTCATPTSLAATGTQTTAAVSFTGPANGSSYVIVYGPTGFNPATAGTTTASFTTSPFTVTGLTASTCYDFYVRATCVAPDQSRLAGPVTFCTPCTPPIITTFPFAQDFNTIGQGQALPCGISVTDVNADNNTWRARATVPTQANPNLPIGRGGSGNAMVYFFNTNDNTVGADDWFYTPALRLTAGQRYRLSFWLRSFGASFPEGLEVKYGNAATPAGQTNTLYSNTSVTSSTYVQATNTSNPAVSDFTPTTTGIYYIGFHAISAADQFFLAVDDVNVTAVLGTSAALTRAINVFPNPSNSGKFNLEVRGANAKSLGVEVTNMLGQRVFTGAAKDNFTNEVDLSALAPGIYTLKVKNGSEYSQQQISIVK